MNRDENVTNQPSRVAGSYWYSATHSRAGSISFSHHLLPSSLVLFLLVALPTICVKVPPTVDYVNHLARSYIIAFGSDDPLLSTFYTIQWKLVPNLAIDLIVPTLAHIFGIFNAGKLFLLSYMALVLTGSQAIHYALFRKFSLGPLVAALFIYNGEFRDGIVNYLFGAGLALWGVAAWIALRRAHPLVRLATSLAFVVVLFICHLGAVGLYGLGLLSFELWLLFTQGHFHDRRLWADMGVFFAPFLTVPVLMAFGPTANFVSTFHWSLRAKFYGLYQVIRSESIWVDLWICLAMAVAFAIAWRFGRVRVHPLGWALLAVAVPVYLLVPQEFLSANDVDVRIPIGVLFLGIGMLQWNLPTMRMQYTFLAVVLLFALVRVGYIATIYFPFRNVVANLEESLQQVPLGSRVMIARPHDRHDVHSMVSLRQPEVIGLFYLPCLAMIERSSLVSIAHSHPAQQVLTVRPAFREFTGGYDDDPLDIADLLAGTLPIGSPPGKRLYWKDWTKHYDYLYLIWDSDLNNPAPDLLIQQYQGRNFRLYRVAS